MMNLYKKMTFEKDTVPEEEPLPQPKAGSSGQPKQMDPPPVVRTYKDGGSAILVRGQSNSCHGHGFRGATPQPLKSEKKTLIEVNDEYCSYKSIFSAWLPSILTALLCIVLEGPYPYKPGFKRFANWTENWDSLVVPALTPISTVILAHFFGCLWNYMTISMPDDLTRATHSVGRVVDCLMGIFVYRGLLNFLTLWELVDRKVAFGCFDNDQCPVKGSICEAIAVRVSYPTSFFLPGETHKLCNDGKSMKLGDLLVMFLITLTLLCIFFTYRLYSELKFVTTMRPPIRVTYTKGNSKKVREFSSLAEIRRSPTCEPEDVEGTGTKITKPKKAKLQVLEPGGVVVTEDADMTESMIEIPTENRGDSRRRTLRSSLSRNRNDSGRFSKISGSSSSSTRSKAGQSSKTQNGN